MKPGLLINPDSLVGFNFENKQLQAYEGDCVSSALWRNGIRNLTRSFKYHRRRGILSLSGDDANVIFDIDHYPNANGDLTRITSGMSIRERRHCYSLQFDLLAGMQHLSPLLPAGFYYQAFYRPHGVWRYWEPLIRRLAGLGIVNQATRPVFKDTIYKTYDVIVIGGGRAGISAAEKALIAGRSVALLDKGAILGGSLNWLPQEESQNILISNDIDVFNNTHVTGIFADQAVTAVCRSPQNSFDTHLSIFHGREIVIATGVRDLACLFTNNDLPGVMLTSAALRLVYLYDVIPGKRIVMLASSILDYRAARALRDYGIEIEAIFILVSEEAEWVQSLRSEKFKVYGRPQEFAAYGKKQVEGVRCQIGERLLNLTCDCILMSGAKVPKMDLAVAGVKFSYDDSKNSMVGSSDKSAITLAGAVSGQFSVSEEVSFPKDLRLTSKSKNCFIDFEEDLKIDDIATSVREGYQDIQLLKRYTTAGMGVAQGKLGNMLVLQELSKQTGQAVSDLGQVTTRPPASAETLAQLAGRPMHPVRLGAAYLQQKHWSARMLVAGEWLRPACYTAIQKEAMAIRTGVGIIDVSTLGKIAIRGVDARLLLERVYAGAYASMKLGQVRYALLLDESGYLVDDGVVACLGENHFWLTTTTSNADAIYRTLIFWCAYWNLKAEVVNMTSAYSAVNVAGPMAEEILHKIWPTANWNIPYMQARQLGEENFQAVLLRVGFVGEKGYEIHLPTGYFSSFWKVLEEFETGVEEQPHIVCCGVEAQRLLRLEKGHLIIGQDTDSLTTVREANMSWAVSADKPFFVGQGAMRIHNRQPQKRKIMGFTLNKEWEHYLQESDLIIHHDEIVGRVTSVSYSSTLDCIIGLAYVPTSTVVNTSINIRVTDGAIIQAKVVPLPFYDKKGERQ